MKMKKRLCALLLAAGLIAVCTGCNMSRLEGEWQGNTYQLPDVGVQVTLPEHLTQVTGETLTENFGKDAKDFYRFVAWNPEEKQVLTCFVLPSDKTDGAAYLESVREELEPLRDWVGEIVREEISGLPILTMEAGMENVGVEMRELCIIHETDAWLICLDYSYPADAGTLVRAGLADMLGVFSANADQEQGGAA